MSEKGAGIPSFPLTRRQKEVLLKMRDEDEELIYSKGQGYVGFESVGRSVVFGLIRHCAIRLDQFSELGKCERYTINSTGRELLGERPENPDAQTSGRVAK